MSISIRVRHFATYRAANLKARMRKRPARLVDDVTGTNREWIWRHHGDALADGAHVQNGISRVIPDTNMIEAGQVEAQDLEINPVRAT